MKKHLLALFSICLILSACSNDERQIRNAAQGYLEATGNYNIEDAYPFATKKTRETTLPYITETLMNMVDSNYIKSNVPATIALDSLLILDDTAWVVYTKTTPLRSLRNNICLIKEEGKWLVDVPLFIPTTFKMTPEGLTSDTSLHDLNQMLPITKNEQ